MASTKVFLDTDVIINWLCKEIDPSTKLELWKAPYEILRRIEAGRLGGYTSLINLMEIVFVLRRKKKWKEGKISSAMSKFQEINNITVWVPNESDIISGYNLQNVFNLDPFDSIYYAILRGTTNCLISRDKDFVKLINREEKQRVAFSPEEFLEKVKGNRIP